MKSKIKLLSSAFLLSAVATLVILSCAKDATVPYAKAKKQQLAYYLDSIRVHDSLTRIDQGGIINYSIQVVSGSTSSLFSSNAGGRVKGGDINNAKTTKSQDAVAGAVVTINQYGKMASATTDATGYVVFPNLLRGGIGVTIQSPGFTDVSFVAALQSPTATPTYNGTVNSMANLIPLFETTGTNMATLTGEATVETDLTNTTRELIPDGTVITATIDATNTNFAKQFLNNRPPATTITAQSYVGQITGASYGTGGFSGKTVSGIYSIAIPAAVDGLPVKIVYPDFAGTQKVFEVGTGSGGAFNQIVSYRQLYGSAITASTVPSAAGVNINFKAGAGAAADAVMNFTGLLSQINVTNGGFGYNGTPAVTITGGGGTGATATANVTGGVISSITLVSPGAGYTSAPAVNIISGSGASASTTLDNTKQSVFAVTVGTPGTGYTSAPAVTFTGGGGTGAAGVATISNGQVVSVIVTTVGTNYTSAPAVGFTGGAGTGAAATVTGMGSPLVSVNLTGSGSQYLYAPILTIDPPNFANGTQATATAVVDPNSQVVTGYVLTNAGSGYNAPPNVTITSGTGATATASMVGGSVLTATITIPGTEYYTGAPTIEFVTPAGQAGQGATGTAIVANGQVTSINITNGGIGYTGAPNIVFHDPAGAQGFALITNGAIGSITLVNGGFNYTTAPLVTITPTVGAPGGGATATATVAGGQVTGVTVSAGGTGYIGGNVPSLLVNFGSTKGAAITSVVGATLLNDIYYGTGSKQH